MDGKLARGYARQSLRSFEKTYPAALANVSRELFPYYDNLCRKGKLTRQHARDAVSAYGRHIGSQPYLIWMERFGDARHRKLSNRFGEGLHCLRLNLARYRGGASLIVHGDLMLATRDSLEFRSADLTVAITDHAVVRLLERGDERIATFARGLVPGVLIAGLYAARATAEPQPIVVPHQRGLFLGHCVESRGYADWCSVHARVMDVAGEHDTRFAPAQVKAGGVGPTVILSTFVGEAEMAEAQRGLKSRLAELAHRHADLLLDDGIANALYRPLGEDFGAVAGRPIDPARVQALAGELEDLSDTPLWRAAVRGPVRIGAKGKVAVSMG